MPVSSMPTDDKYKVGTLHYTKVTLFALFSWMIWGNLCFLLFESAGGPNILGLFLQDNFHVSNLQVNILFNVIPMVIGTVMTPIVSFKSDRTRSRFGRRIPYILFTMPFLVFFAAALGFSDDIIAFCKTHLSETSFISPFAAALIAIGFLTIGFSFFNEFVGTVYYYLCPDVIPRHFIGRFQGVSQVFGTASGILINIYIIPHQLTHIKAIHVGVAILYFVGFGLLCWRVKEGEYPPVTDVTQKTRFRDQVKLYFRECFTHPVFILFYLSTAVAVLARGLNPSGVFGLHLSQHQKSIVAYSDTDHASITTPAIQRASMVLAMTPDGRWAVSGGPDGLLKVWDVNILNTPVLLTTIDTRSGPVSAVAVSSNGQTLVSGSRGGILKIWEAGTGKCLQRLPAHEGTVCSVALSPDNRLVASAGTDKQVKLWNCQDGTVLAKLSGHDDVVNAVAFSCRGDRLVSGGADKKIIIWDALTGALLKTIEGSPGPVYTVCFSPGLTAVPKSEEPKKGGWASFLGVVESFLTAVFTNESLYDVPPDRTSRILGDDLWILSGGRDGRKDSENSLVRIWDVNNGQLIQTLKGHKQAISCVIYKPDLRVILSGSMDESIRLWRPLAISDAATDQSFKTFSGYTHSVTALACQSRGVKVANASDNGTLHLWDIDRGISLARVGMTGIFLNIIGLLLAYPIGALVDRRNPLKLVLVATAVLIPLAISRFLWLHDYTFSVWASLVTKPFEMLGAMALMPMLIMILPKTKYGQMCSANAMVRQFVAAVAGPAGAIFMDYLTAGSMDTDNFRYGFLFQGLASALSFMALLGVYQYWKKLGAENYVAPEADDASLNRPLP
ncbi:MAG: MFS transporter [bacterium]